MTYNVHAVVLNWNNYEDTESCVLSLLESSYENLQVWIIDNDSDDGSGERLSDRFKNSQRVRYEQTEKNLGYGGGMNKGIEMASEDGADAVFVLNNDIKFPEMNIVEKLVKKLEQHQSLGAISPMIKYMGTDEVKSKGADAVTTIPDGHFQRRRKRFQHEIDDNELNYGVSYSACLFTIEALEEGGLFSEEYFMYVEDIEHAIMIEEAGYHRATHTGVAISHEFHGSTEPHGPLPAYYKARNWLLLHRKRRLEPRGRFIFWYLYFILTRCIHRIITLNISGLLGFVRGVSDGLRGKRGKGPYP